MDRRKPAAAAGAPAAAPLRCAGPPTRCVWRGMGRPGEPPARSGLLARHFGVRFFGRGVKKEYRDFLFATHAVLYSSPAWKVLGSQSAERGRCFALAALTRPELRAAPPLERVAPAEREETLWGDRAGARARAGAGAGAGARARARSRSRSRSRARARLRLGLGRAKGRAWALGRTAHTAKLRSA